MFLDNCDDQFVYVTSTAYGCTSSTPGAGVSTSCYGGGVRRVPLAGGPLEVVDMQGAPAEIFAGARGMYWRTDTELMFVPLSGATARTLTKTRGEGGGSVAADADAVYFGSSPRGRVMKLPIDGGTAKPIAVDLGEVSGVVVSGPWVYVAATNKGQILRISKDGAAARPTAPVEGPCPMPVGTSEEIAATPRRDRSLEALALHLEGDRITASGEMYERVVSDVQAIHATHASLANIGFFPQNDGKTLILTPDALTTQSIQNSQYTAWDCLNSFYGLESLNLSDFEFTDQIVTLELKGLYNTRSIAAVYARLPGIKNAQANGYGGDRSTICAQRDGSTITYVFDERGGDCPAGCTEHDAHAFRSTAPGQIEPIGAWNDHDLATAPPPPDWYSICQR